MPEQLINRLLNALPEPLLILDRQFAVRMANEQARKLLGGSARKLVGQPFLNLIGHDTGEVPRFLRDASGSAQPIPGRLRLVGPHGPLMVDAHAAAIREGAEALIALRLTQPQMSPPAWSALDQRVRGLDAEVDRERRLRHELEEALDEREILLGEVHHRVRNHLQIIASFLNLQMSSLGPGPGREALRDAQARVRALALVHNALYAEEKLGQIDVTRLLSGVAHSVVGVFGAADRVSVSVSPFPWQLSMPQATPLALLITEAITNAIKHGFADGRAGTVTLEQSTTFDRRMLRIIDDGVGFPATRHESPQPTIGFDLMRSFATQLNAALAIADNKAGGVEVRVTFQRTPDAHSAAPA